MDFRSPQDSPAVEQGPGRPELTIVTTVYRSEANLPGAIERLTELQRELACRLEVVFVVDGSPDASLSVLGRALAQPRPFEAQLIALSRNFGALNAVRAGVAAARGDVIAVAAADLQEPTSLLRDFYSTLSSGDYDVAFGVRRRRDDPWRTRVTAALFWRLYRRFIQPEMPKRGVDVFAMTRQVAREIATLRETHTSIIGLLLWVGFRRVEIPYDRARREIGRSSWSFRKRYRYLLDSVYSFSDLPVQVFTAVGAGGIFVSVAVAFAVFIGWAVGDIGVAGYTPIMLAITFIGSAILLALGIIGSYVWRTYENSKLRPYAIPMTTQHYPRRLPAATRSLADGSELVADSQR